MIKRIGITVVAVMALSMAAQAADMDSGTWVLNVAKSSNSGGLARSGMQVVSYDGGWRIIRSTGIDKDGKPTSSATIAKPDGQIRPYVCANTPGDNCYADLRNLTKIDDFNFKQVSAAITGKGKQTNTTVISPDGKTRTVTSEGLSNGGTAYKNVSVWDKRS